MATTRMPDGSLSPEMAFSASQMNAVIRGPAHEKLGLLTTSRAFEGMLKTTTETGDIGLLPVKSLSNTQPLTGPRKIGRSYKHIESRPPRQSLHNGVPAMVDMSQVPSYSRDTSSEIISMHETASQRSASQDVNNPHCRSHPMSQRCSSSPLFNRRSYTSLRSQTGGNYPPQRPRSPFAYPTRLMRPARRPCSPVLANAGDIGCPRRAEAERPSYGLDHGTSSPSPLSTQKQIPPTLQFRHNGNRSTPSLSSQQHRSPGNPHVRHSSEAVINEWQCRHGSSLVNVSPARSTFGLTSTVDLHQPSPAHSASTTPTKVDTSCPSYYDYTEDFDADDYTQYEMVVEPPPQFLIEKAIPEDQPLSVDWMSTQYFNRSDTEQSLNRIFAIPCFTPSDVSSSPHGSQYPNLSQSRTGTLKPDHRLQKSITASLQEMSAGKAAKRTRGKNSIRLSELDYTSPVSRMHAEELVERVPFRPFENKDCHAPTSKDASTRGGFRTSTCNENTFGPEDYDIETRAAISTYSLNTHPRRLPPPPDVPAPASISRVTGVGNKLIQRRGRLDCVVGSYGLIPKAVPHKILSTVNVGMKDDALEQEISGTGSHLLRTSSMELQGVSSKIFSSASAGVTEITGATVGLMNDDGDTSANLPSEGVIYDSSHCSHSPTISAFPDKSKASTIYPQCYTASPLSLLDDESKDNRQDAVSEQGFKRPQSPTKGIKSDTVSVGDYGKKNASNFSGQFDRKVISHSESPVRTSSQILFARPQELENSVTQIEKTLPPLHIDSQATIRDSDYSNPKPPKFRLKITRASDSTPGTVRVNRESADSRPLAPLHLQDPRDLFSSSSGIDNMFSQVNRHLHTPRASSNSSHPQIEVNQTSILAPISGQFSGNWPPSVDLSIPQPSTGAANPTSPSGAQSFFSEDSSHIYGKRSLRKRLSNLRALVAMPYASKSIANFHDGTHSYKDINWRNKHCEQHPTLSAARSAHNLQAARASTEDSRIRRLTNRVHAWKLRDRVSGWIKEARSVIVSRTKPGSVGWSGSGED